MRLILEPIPDHPGCYLMVYAPRSGTSTPDIWNGFVDEVKAWFATREIDYADCYRIIHLTDDQAFETRMRWG